MAATKEAAPDATPALNFTAIDRRADELNVDRLELADFLGLDKTTVWRWRNGLTVPSFGAIKEVAAKLGLSLDEITAVQGNPTPAPPPGPTTPAPPPGPRGK
jgi:transcriptional regulator with XRE-family HTH domain